MIIGRLTGEVAALGLDHVLVDVNGVGYVCMSGTRLLSRVHAGEKITVHVETRVTENSITLYGFGTDEERAWFVRLQDVHGVAGKAAMAILDALTPAELMDAIALGDSNVLTRAKGVGKKLAERIVGELAGKAPPMGRFGKFEAASAAGMASAPVAASTGPRGEAISALVNLGYSQSDAARAVASVAKDAGDDVGGLIKSALRELAQ
ncbi:MAG TPA: Holliday junction branch migration protein RuvA [Hyphomonas sp.]|nr:Holliday junction branch migration protein RuvA [Hyphomonas sp.]MCA8906175.1 Holliday junction branch migration protein RuvA [Hyphomonas sp.]MCB9961966.1 Holliday junction branch migration protein RuvA [Hyphomonas sp.]MCB9970958.1 Holliday junction branch migration protein RuvA [Hyphomonas sp.]HPE47490.1 Holliday junction branch migration protein RuvA [Hyphomonas sp.]